MNRYQALFNLFTTASSHLKYPKITYPTKTGDKIQLYLATKGYIAIKVNGEYVGKIQPFQDTNGEWQSSFRMYQGSTKLQTEVESICASPLAYAVMKGLEYKHCCFCGLELTNKASLQMGYGPICADNYGLPWKYTEVEDKLIDL